MIFPKWPLLNFLLDSFRLTLIECFSKTLLVFFAILELHELEDFDYSSSSNGMQIATLYFFRLNLVVFLPTRRQADDFTNKIVITEKN